MIAAQKVRCFACGRTQADEGRRATCGHCGFSPVPSYDYPKRCCFHAQWRKVKRRKKGGPVALR